MLNYSKLHENNHENNHEINHEINHENNVNETLENTLIQASVYIFLGQLVVSLVFHNRQVIFKERLAIKQ